MQTPSTSKQVMMRETTMQRGKDVAKAVATIHLLAGKMDKRRNK